MPTLGYFIYRDLGDGCISSKFSNLSRTQAFSESATKTHVDRAEPDHVFLGIFDACWIDSSTPILTGEATLTITRKQNSRAQFALRWTRPGTTQVLFYGEGMLHDGVLVGAYWDEVIEQITDLHTIVP